MDFLGKNEKEDISKVRSFDQFNQWRVFPHRFEEGSEDQRHLDVLKDLNDSHRFEYLMQCLRDHNPVALNIPTAGGKGAMQKYLRALLHFLGKEFGYGENPQVLLVTPEAHFAEADGSMQNGIINIPDKEKRIFTEEVTTVFTQDDPLARWDDPAAYNAMGVGIALVKFFQKVNTLKAGESFSTPFMKNRKVVVDGNVRIGVEVKKSVNRNGEDQYSPVYQEYKHGETVVLIDSFVPEVYYYYFQYLDYIVFLQAYEKLVDDSDISFEEFLELNRSEITTNLPIGETGIINKIKVLVNFVDKDSNKSKGIRLIRRMLREYTSDPVLILLIMTLSETYLYKSNCELNTYLQDFGTERWGVEQKILPDDTDHDILRQKIKEIKEKQNQDARSRDVDREVVEILPSNTQFEDSLKLSWDIGKHIKIQIVRNKVNELYMRIKIDEEFVDLPIPHRERQEKNILDAFSNLVNNNTRLGISIEEAIFHIFALFDHPQHSSVFRLLLLIASANLVDLGVFASQMVDELKRDYYKMVSSKKRSKRRRSKRNEMEVRKRKWAPRRGRPSPRPPWKRRKRDNKGGRETSNLITLDTYHAIEYTIQSQSEPFKGREFSLPEQMENIANTVATGLLASDEAFSNIYGQTTKEEYRQMLYQQISDKYGELCLKIFDVYLRKLEQKHKS